MTLTKQEKEILKQLDKDLKSGNDELYRQIMSPIKDLEAYKETPVSIKEFITNRTYLGNSWLDDNNKLTMFPFWWSWVQHSKWEDVNVVAFSGSTGPVDKDTEYFNGRCWKPISQYKDDKVLQYNPTTRIANLVKPFRYTKLKDQNLNILKTKKGISQKITDDHSFVYERNGRLSYTRFDEVKDKIINNTLDGNILSSFKYSGTGIDLSNEEIRLRAREILSQPKGAVGVEEWWYKASSEQVDIICSEIEMAALNRCKGVCRSMVYHTNDKRKADFVQFIYSATNRKANIAEKNGTYSVSLSANDKTRIYRTNSYQGQVKGDAYCFEVPSGHLVLRNNNKIFITGNCGKTAISVVLFLYDLYKVMCLKNPRNYFELSGKKKIMFIAVNPLGLQVAQENAYGTIITSIEQSPWFRKNGIITGDIYKNYRPRGAVGLKFASRKSQVTGLDIYAAILDEISEQVGDLKKQQRAALELITTIRERQTSRFANLNQDPTHMFLASSSKVEMSFLETWIRKQVQLNNKNIRVVSRPRWEILPKERFDWGKSIYVALGDKVLPNTLIGHNKAKLKRDDEFLADYIKQGYKILEMPHDKGFMESCQNDLDLALTNIAGISIANSVRYINAFKWRECCTEKRNPFKTTVITVGRNDALKYIDLFTDVFTSAEKRKKMFLHMDTSYAKDKTGISMVTIDSVTPDGKVMYRVLFTVSIQAPKGDEISLEKNREFVRDLKKLGFKLEVISMDTFQSVDTRQQLEAEKYKIQIVSMDRVDKNKVNEPYLTLKNATHENRIISPVNELLEKELGELERDNLTGKIDHLADGSKDSSDSLAGALFVASQNIEMFIQQFGYSDAKRIVQSVSGKKEKDSRTIEEKLEQVKSEMFKDVVKEPKRRRYIR